MWPRRRNSPSRRYSPRDSRHIIRRLRRGGILCQRGPDAGRDALHPSGCRTAPSRGAAPGLRGHLGRAAVRLHSQLESGSRPDGLPGVAVSVVAPTYVVSRRHPHWESQGVTDSWPHKQLHNITHRALETSTPRRGAAGATGTRGWASECPPCGTPTTRWPVGPFPPRALPRFPGRMGRSDSPPLDAAALVALAGGAPDRRPGRRWGLPGSVRCPSLRADG